VEVRLTRYALSIRTTHPSDSCSGLGTIHEIDEVHGIVGRRRSNGYPVVAGNICLWQIVGQDICGIQVNRGKIDR